MLEESQQQAQALAVSAVELRAQANNFETSITQLGRDLSQIQISRDRWKIAALVAVGIAIVEGVLIALK